MDEVSGMQVADALDDSHIAQWVRIAAKHLASTALSTCSQTVKADVVEGLAALPCQLQHRLLVAAAFDSKHLDRLTAFFPTCIHSVVLSAMISSDRSLHMPLAPGSGPALEALASLPASPPSLLSFHAVHSQYAQGIGQDIGSSLTRILQHHSRLTRLGLSGCVFKSNSRELLCAAVANLTSLLSLDLGGCFIHPGKCSKYLKETLNALPRLGDLKLNLVGESAHDESLKRQRDVEPAPTPRHCLAAMLCPCTALTSLHLEVVIHPFNFRMDRFCFTAERPVRMPHLVRLTAFFGVNIHLGATFFSHLSAPLTSLELNNFRHRPLAVPCAAADDAGGLLRSLSAFTQLRYLSTILPTDEQGQSSVQEAMISSLSGELTPLQHLQNASIAAPSAVLPRAMRLLTATALTQLRLGPFFDTVNRSTAPEPNWPETFRCLRSLNLQALDLDFQGAQLTGFGLAALSALTQLTLLKVHDWSCLCGPADAQALAAMTQLQRLCLEQTSKEFLVSPACVTSLHALSALTYLLLKTSARDEDLVREMAARPLLALHELTVALYDSFEAAEALERYVGELPELRCLTVHLRNSPDLLYDSEDNDEWTREMTQRLTLAAALAGVQSSIQDETA